MRIYKLFLHETEQYIYILQNSTFQFCSTQTILLNRIQQELEFRTRI